MTKKIKNIQELRRLFLTRKGRDIIFLHDAEKKYPEVIKRLRKNAYDNAKEGE